MNIHLVKKDAMDEIIEFKGPKQWDGACCKNCLFFFKAVDRRDGRTVASQCRRYPPMPMLMPGRVAGTAQMQGVHAPVSEEWVCGEHSKIMGIGVVSGRSESSR